MRRQLHQSGVEMAGKCGMQFYYRYIEGKKRRPSSYLICGIATDRSVGTDLDKKIATGELEQEDVLLDVARDAVETYPNKENLELDEEEKGKSINDVLGATKDKAVRFVKAHHGQVAPAMFPFQTARQFSIDLDAMLRARASELHIAAEEEAVPIRKAALHNQARYLNVAARDGMDFVGEMDIVERFSESTIHPGPIQVIRDLKTSKKSPSAGTADGSHQLTAYSLASFVIDGFLPDAVRLDYLIDLKGGVKCAEQISVRDQRDVLNYVNRIVSVVSMMQSGIFVPAPSTAWWCDKRYCGYYEQCPYVRNQVQILPPVLSGKAGKNAGLVTIDVDKGE
jgi:hypothetical protein